jgi:hypothetical protein
MGEMSIGTTANNDGDRNCARRVGAALFIMALTWHTLAIPLGTRMSLPVTCTVPSGMGRIGLGAESLATDS